MRNKLIFDLNCYKIPVMSAKKVVIEISGKQHLVSEGDKIVVNQIKAEVGTEIELDRVLLVTDGETTTIGEPNIDGAKVKIKILANKKAEKVVVARFRAKSRHRRKNGHKQPISEVEVVSISA
jgi:large subunit ribosomal protein L21